MEEANLTELAANIAARLCGNHEHGCALDTFMYTALLDQPTQVISHCPITGRQIALAMTPAHISELTPASAGISLVIPDGSIADCRRSAFCNHGHFFASAAASAHWLQEHPNGMLLTAADAHHLGRLIAQHLFKGRMLCCQIMVLQKLCRGRAGDHPTITW